MRLAPVISLAALLALSQEAVAQSGLGLRDGISPEAIDETPTASTPRRAIAEEDPYEALGIRAGGFILYPSLTVVGGYSTNASATAGGAASTFGTVTPELLIKSDWDRHEATVTLRGSYERFFDNVTPDDRSASADGTLRLDLADQWSADFSAGYGYGEQGLSDPGLPAGVDRPPSVHDLTGSAALNGVFGRGTFTIEASADRTLYQNATVGGVPVDQGDRTNTDFGGRLRVGYQATATLTPFVEGAVSRRLYDRPIDNSGIRRASTGLAGRAGVVFDRDPFLRGEVSAGAAQEDFDDASLATIRAMTFDGSLVWSPTVLTTVTFDGSTRLNPSTDPASAGSVAYNGSVAIAYAWRQNFSVDGTASVSSERFQGTNLVDTTYRVGLGATWKINRTVHLTGGYVHEWLRSTTPAADYQSDTVRLELRLQR